VNYPAQPVSGGGTFVIPLTASTTTNGTYQVGNGIAVSTSGWYLVSYSLDFSYNPGSYITVKIANAGGTQLDQTTSYQNVTSSSVNSIGKSVLVYLIAGQEYDLTFLSNNTGTLYLPTSGAQLSVVKVSQ
jgi:hypothetical protein